MDFMKECKDKQFDLAIVDPPYGIDIANSKNIGGTIGLNYIATEYKLKDWDKNKPNAEYFGELFRVSKNQIVWGFNYLSDLLPTSRGVVFWDKLIGDNNFSAGELAWTSFDIPLKKFEHYHGGNRVANNKEKAKKYIRIHPTQKPVKLYKWLLKNYAKEGDTILDTHLGSGSSRIACYDYGFDFTGIELDKDYFEAQEKRFNNHIAQVNMFKCEKP